LIAEYRNTTTQTIEPQKLLKPRLSDSSEQKVIKKHLKGDE